MSSAAQPPLIYDVGVENGDDSAYYLHSGFRVIGVEASPIAADSLRTRFADEIGSGRYILLNVGIAETAGEAAFWVCDDHPPWSSFDRSIAGRNGARHHSEIVETRAFRSILEEFGPALYCKIDIEGSDNLCVDALTPEIRPSYLSVELIDGDEQLRLLREKGYSQFKVISQRSFRQPSPRLLRIGRLLPSIARRGLAAVGGHLRRYEPSSTWRFRGGSSGPFGERSHGSWRSFDEALETCRLIDRGGTHLFDWHDIHARLTPLDGQRPTP